MELHITIKDGKWLVEGEPYLTTSQAATLTGMRQDSVVRLLNSGKLKRSIRLLPRVWLVSADELDEYEKNKKPWGAQPGPRPKKKRKR